MIAPQVLATIGDNTLALAFIAMMIVHVGISVYNRIRREDKKVEQEILVS